MLKIKLRAAGSGDMLFLNEMLFEAFFWRPNQVRPSLAEFSKNREFEKMLRGWGRAGDTALVAEVDGRPAGAGWYRLWKNDEHSYGFVDESTPELGLGVLAFQRGGGIGRALLRALVTQANLDGFAAISLSVEPGNYSRLLYETEGFIKVGENGDAWTMFKQL